jgi:RNA polymerase sigma-70 factor (ECF subfamily)
MDGNEVQPGPRHGLVVLAPGAVLMGNVLDRCGHHLGRFVRRVLPQVAPRELEMFAMAERTSLGEDALENRQVTFSHDLTVSVAGMVEIVWPVGYIFAAACDIESVRDDSTDSRYEGRSDAWLLRAARQDPRAFSEIYTRHVAAVYGWCRRRLAWAASDLTAETFARAWLRRDRFRDDRNGSALPWLLGIAAKLVADAVRHERIDSRARQRLGLPLDLASEDDYAEVDARLSPSPALDHALGSLPSHEREALELRVIDELPYGQIAERLEIRPAAARLRVSRALRRLATSVSREER